MKGLLTTAVVACLLSGCAENGADALETSRDQNDSTQASLSAGEVTVLVSKPAGAGMEALGGGRLEVLSGCLGASGSVIVWPHGTEVVKEEPLIIDVPNYGTFALDDEVQVSGGYVLEHSSNDVEPGDYQAGGVTVPADCARHDIFVAN
jgi:hypothetical protein